MMPSVRLRDLRTGQTLILPGVTAVEVLDDHGDVGVLLLPDHTDHSLRMITHSEEPETARQYAATHNIRFSQVLVPNLGALQEPPKPTKF